MTKKELQQLQTRIQKLEKQAVSDNISERMFPGGGTTNEQITNIYKTIEEINILFSNYDNISITPPEKNENLLCSLRQWITLAKYRLQQLETTSEEILIHNVIDKKFYDMMK